MVVLPPTGAVAVFPPGGFWANAVIGGGGAGVMMGGGGAGGMGGAGGLTFTGQITQKIQYMVGSREAPEGNEFATCLNLFISDIELGERGKMGLHYILWSELFSDKFDDYGTVIRNKLGLYPAFGSEITKRHFEDWLVLYEKTFFPSQDMNLFAYPSPQSGDLKGLWIEDRVDWSTPNDWLWIVRHYTHKIIRLDKGWLFSNETEAIHFKMR